MEHALFGYWRCLFQRLQIYSLLPHLKTSTITAEVNFDPWSITESLYYIISSYYRRSIEILRGKCSHSAYRKTVLTCSQQYLAMNEHLTTKGIRKNLNKLASLSLQLGLRRVNIRGQHVTKSLRRNREAHWSEWKASDLCVQHRPHLVSRDSFPSASRADICGDLLSWWLSKSLK